MTFHKGRRNLPLGILLLALTIAGGCTNARKVQLQQQLQTLASQNDSLRQSISDQQSTLEAMHQRLNVQRAQLSEYNAGVQGYMLEHKMAVAALVAGVGGSIPMLDTDNQYSDEAKEIGAAVTVVAAVWALANMDEVSQVLKTLNEADAHVRSLRVQIAETSSAIQQQTASIQQADESLRNLTQRRIELQRELDQL